MLYTRSISPRHNQLQETAMGLLDGLLSNVLGSALGGGQAGGANPMLNAVIGMLANNAGGQAGAQGGAAGGLGGLMQQFQQAGLGHVMDSWVGSGDNHPISADQLTQVLGSGQIGQIAQQLGLSHGDAAGQLSQILPQIINHVTPNGQAPAGGLGSAGDIMGMLGGLLGGKQ
jgi:uncharacterized protein YidB (DUF937 family)